MIPRARRRSVEGMTDLIVTSPQGVAATGPHVTPPDAAERFAGYALMGQPFRSGHYLAFRHFTASSIGPAYRAVWLRTPDRRWTIFADAAPEQSCMRYIGSAAHASVTTRVLIDWDGPFAATVRIPDTLEWRFTLADTGMTRLVSGIAAAMPDRLWQSGMILAAMGRMMRPMLRAGSMRLTGRTPNAQTFQFRPERVWRVADTSAVLSGVDVGAPGPLAKPERLADLRMPQRGLFTADLSVRYPSTADPVLSPRY